MGSAWVEVVVCCELLKRSREDGTEYPEWPWQGKKGKSVVSYTHCYCRVTAHHHDITWSYVNLCLVNGSAGARTRLRTRARERIYSGIGDGVSRAFCGGCTCFFICGREWVPPALARTFKYSRTKSTIERRYHQRFTTERKHPCVTKSFDDTSYELPSVQREMGSNPSILRRPRRRRYTTTATVQQYAQKIDGTVLCCGLGGAQYDKYQS